MISASWVDSCAGKMSGGKRGRVARVRRCEAGREVGSVRFGVETRDIATLSMNMWRSPAPAHPRCSPSSPRMLMKRTSVVQRRGTGYLSRGVTRE